MVCKVRVLSTWSHLLFNQTETEEKPQSMTQTVLKLDLAPQCLAGWLSPNQMVLILNYLVTINFPCFVPVVGCIMRKCWVSSGLFYSLIMYCVLCIMQYFRWLYCNGSMLQLNHSKYWYSASIIKGNYGTNITNTFHDLCSHLRDNVC